VLLVDDHPMIRHGMSALLGLEPWVGRLLEAGTFAEALALAVTQNVDAAVVDLGLPDGDGVGLVRRIRASVPGCAVVVLTMTRDEATVRTCLEAGAGGYVLKESAPESLIDALRTVLGGGVYLGPNVGTDLLAGLRRDIPPPFDLLTPRELHIVVLLASGLATADIARKVSVTEKTVRNQLAAALPKLGVADRVQAVLLARDLGLLG